MVRRCKYICIYDMMAPFWGTWGPRNPTPAPQTRHCCLSRFKLYQGFVRLYNKITATFQLKTYCPECFPSWFSSSCLGQVCSVHAKSQSRVQSHASSHACIHIHCQWIATFHGHTLYQPHTSSYKKVVKKLIYNGVCEVDRMPPSPQTTLRVPSVLCFSLYVVPILFFKLFSTIAAL